MGYGYTCNAQVADTCEGEYADEFPPFAGEFTESFLKGEGGAFADEFGVGEKVTICADCMAVTVL